jgi:transposase-like protein
MLLLDSSVSGLFEWRQFEPEVILLAVGWYLRSSLSYRDVEELLAERGLLVDHVTVWRWVQRYAPELRRRLGSRLRPTNDSWRLDETYVRVKGKWRYLYRAVDSSGATIDFLLSAKQDAVAAKRFFVKALGGVNHPAPRVINTDGYAAYPPADPELAKTNPDAKLPNLEIMAVFRSDGSGTTYIWTDYLAKVSEEWDKEVGYGTLVPWPVGLGGSGNGGVAHLVKETPYSIGYVELAYAIQETL